MTDAIDQVQHAKSTLQRKTAKFDESLREADTEGAGGKLEPQFGA